MQAFSWRVASSPSPAMALRAAAVAGSSSARAWWRWPAAAEVSAVAAHWPLATGIDRRTVPLRTSLLKRSRSVFAWDCSWVRWSARCARAAPAARSSVSTRAVAWASAMAAVVLLVVAARSSSAMAASLRQPCTVQPARAPHSRQAASGRQVVAVTWPPVP